MRDRQRYGGRGQRRGRHSGSRARCREVGLPSFASAWRSTLIDGGDPRAILRRLTADRVEVDAADLRGDRTGLAFADLAVVDAGDRRDLRPGAAQEDLIGDIELSAVHLTDRRVDPSV